MDKQQNIEKYRVDGMSLKKKTDKIAAAIHLVTDCLEDNEPMRFKLRSLAIELATDSHALIHAMSRDRGIIFADLEVVATEIMSFISIAQSVGMISRMNGDILLRELTGNTERMRGWTETGFYETEESRRGTSGPAAFTLSSEAFRTDDEGHPKPSAAVSFSQPQTQLTKGPMQTIHEHKPIQRQDQSDTRKFEIANKLNRRNNILKIIKDKKEVTIKDITTLIGDVSEKTVQRELTTLVSEGVLKRVGEKRWSKYMLA